MKKNKSTIFILLLLFNISCQSDQISKSFNAEDLKGEKWYFYSINDGVAYPCVRQTNLLFLEDGSLEIETFIHNKDYTCSGPIKSKANWTLENNNTALRYGNEVYSLTQLTNMELIKTIKSKEGKEYKWVYKRKE